MKKNTFIDIICFLLVLLFIYTAVSKFTDFTGFIGDLNNQPFPNTWTPFLSWFIPSVEIVIALFLLFEDTVVAGLYASALLMTVFSIYTLLVLLQLFPYVPCSCGGVLKQLSWKQHLAFNLFFVIISIAGILIKKNKIDTLKNFHA